ncbi:MAG: hypothetical protein PHC28_13455 [Flavobacterium sp.]|uniref:hypothetical protein n=1 Tax=Flavobacterium sp. TaxID=239 RepID=UPI00262F35C6|nr:hypothetical protein [Flavobacterium sp.]MDD5151459.1 hypothetical protein [Flavobacterium sp.]
MKEYIKIKQGDFVYYINKLQETQINDIILKQKMRGLNYDRSEKYNHELLLISDFCVSLSNNTLFKNRASSVDILDVYTGIKKDALNITIETLRQISDIPRNSRAKRNASATLKFLESLGII